MKGNTASILFLIFFLSFSAVSFSQKGKIDSLKIELEKHKERDSIRVTILNNLADTHYRKDFDKAINYLNESEAIAKSIGYKKGEARTLHIKGIAYALNTKYTFGDQYLKDALKLYEQMNDKSGTSLVFNSLGVFYYKKRDFKKAINYYSQYSRISEEIGNSTRVIIGLLFVAMSTVAQRAVGVRIGYVDMEYILENVEEYRDATEQLNTKASKWKQEIELKLGKVEQMKKDLAAERVLLTDELIAEREEEIQILQTEVLDYQQDRFGPQGDLVLQKRLLVQPIQDQVFVEVQKIGKNKRYDFIFDKSADVVMLYSEKRHDISDLVLREIARTRKVSKSNKAEKEKNRLKEFQAEEAEADKEISDALKERQAKAQTTKEERAKAAEAKRAEQLKLREERKKAYEERRKKLLEEREAKRKAK